ncbi:MAG: formyltetrahydrofolate deformylase [Verrucomicrobiota bacterium]|nr:formyltetrahydrofolate deformylase [Limisphaera sp.]MDW8382861.1 formyltetrahydrofolate deformylase [Verrucomicrobiota bacterium]
MKRHATLTVIGRDKTGVIARITNFLFQQGANIEALEEQVTRGQFSMTLQATWHPRHLDEAVVRQGLEKLGRELEMEITLRFIEPHRVQRMAILVTREPHCLEALLHAWKNQKLRGAEPVVVIGNRPDLQPLARQHQIPFLHIPWEDRNQAEQKALETLEQYQCDFVVLARFMKILSPNFVWRYKNKIINIHPSLLPSFPGPQAYRQAWERGVKIVGVSAHFVTMHLDEGPIIAQSAFPVTRGMTLADIVARGRQHEAKTLLRAIRLFLSKRLDVYWGIVKEV